MRISGILIMVLLAFGVLSGMIGFMSDLSLSYNVPVPETLRDNTDAYAKSINQTATDIIDISQSEGGWVETVYNIFFKLPASLVSTVGNSLSTTMSFVSVTTSESYMPIPDWFIVMISIILIVLFAFSILYMITGRRV